MNLEINKNHLKLDLTKINKKNLLKLLSLGTTIAITVFSGLGLEANNVLADDNVPINIEQVDETILSDLNPVYKSAIANACNKDVNDIITKEDLKNIENLSFDLVEDDIPFWLRDCTNLKKLTINFNCNPNFRNFNLPYLQELNLNINENVEFNDFYFNFLKNLKGDKLNISGNFIDEGYLKELKNFSAISLDLNNGQNNIVDFNEIENLSEIVLHQSEVYNYAINLDSNTIANLQAKGVKIVSDDNTLEMLTKINSKLDEIVNSLNLSNNSTDKEKLDAILIYVLTNYSYSKEMLEMENNQQYSSAEYKEATSKFSQNGYLSKIFEGNDNELISGNYTALVSALMNRVPGKLNNYIVNNDVNEWNLVQVEGEYYYVDSAYLDLPSLNDDYYLTHYHPAEAIKHNDTENLDYYMEKVNINTDSEHQVSNIPFLIQKIAADDNNPENNLYSININGNSYTVTLASAIGIMAAVGLAKKIRNLKTKKETIQDDNVKKL